MHTRTVGRAAAALFMTGASAHALAGTIHVRDGDANGLISAIATANSAGSGTTIILSRRGHYFLNTAAYGDRALPDITGSITIEGHGAVVARSYAPQTPAFGILHVRASGSLSLKGVTVANGSTIYGGCLAVDGRLAIENDSQVTGCQAVDGGGIFVGYGGLLELHLSTVADNLAYYGGGILGDNGSTTRIALSRITGNRAVQQPAPVAGGWGGGIASMGFGAGLDSGTSLLVQGSLIDGNFAVEGGGILSNIGQATIVHTIITENNASSGHGGGVAALFQANLTANYDCITRNSSFAFYSDGRGSVPNATWNWWGAASGPSGSGTGAGDAVSSNVTYIPFLRAPIFGVLCGNKAPPPH